MTKDRFDVAVAADAAVGTFFTHAQAALEFRFGVLPSGFVDVPSPVGRTIDHYGSLREVERKSFYGSLVIRGTNFFHALPRDGNVFRNNNAWTEQNMIKREDMVGQLVLGAHYEAPTWGAHLNFWLSTKTVTGRSLTNIEDPKNSFVVLSFEWSK